MTMMRDVVLFGPAGVGKDTVAKHLVDNFGFTRVAFADALKNVLRDIDPFVSGGRRLSDLLAEGGWDAAKAADPEVRRLLQETGMAVREVDPSFWLWALETFLEDHFDGGLGPVVVTDVRMPNEWSWARYSLHKPLFVRLDRDGLSSAHAAVGEAWRSHISECALQGPEFVPDVEFTGHWGSVTVASKIFLMSREPVSSESLGYL